MFATRTIRREGAMSHACHSPSTGTSRRSSRRLRRVRHVLLLALALLAGATATASAIQPRWSLDSLSNSTVAASGRLTYLISISNRTDSPSFGVPYTLTVRLPAGVTGDSMIPDVTGNLPSLGCPSVSGESTIICTGTDVLGRYSRGGMYLTVNTALGAVPSITITIEMESDGISSTRGLTGDATLVSATPPQFGIAAFDGQVGAQDGSGFSQAAGHPYDATTWIDFHAINDPLHGAGLPGLPETSLGWPVEAVKDVFVDLPPGFVGNPSAVAECAQQDLANSDDTGFPTCSPASQVGTTSLYLNGTAASVIGPIPVFNITPPADVPARFGFVVSGSIVTLDGELRSGSDYGLSVNVDNVPAALGVAGTAFTFWGTPASSAHDWERNCPGEPPLLDGASPCRAGIFPKPFLRNPTACTAPGVGLRTTVRVDSWQDPGDFKESSFISHDPPSRPFLLAEQGGPKGPDGCERVPFNPSLSAEPSPPRHAGGPTAFSFDLSLPQSEDASVPGSADLKKAVVTLPEGVRVGPGSAHGLAACSPEQIGLRTTADPTCPEASKIGTLSIDTPLLDDPLDGGIYLATPFNNPSRSLIAIYIVARGPGTIVKLPGSVSPDPRTGQMTATFDDNPQLPFENLHLEFKGGDRAPLVLPKRCGTYTTRAVLTSWSGSTVQSDSDFTLTENAKGQPCPSTFDPKFEAGTESNAAGKSSTFNLQLTREDEDQELVGLTFDMPEGLTGRIADVPLCSAADGKAGTCSEASRVGRVVTGAGAGPDPFYITDGRVYLTEGYDGAPFGLSIVVPAIAGPFDLGTVVVRSQIFVDRHTAELRIVSEPLPTILEGIPLDVKDVRVSINRDGFFLNPTSCAEKTIRGTITSLEGRIANVSSRYQAADCSRLPLRPRMVLQVGGRGRTQRGRSTPLNATLRQAPGQTGLDLVRVTLPTTINARLTVINDACTRAQYESGSDVCEFARTGDAVAATPLLRDPLRGGVYFVRNGNPLPDLFVRLRGQVDFDLIGKITIPGSKRLRTTFDVVPDVPVSMFSLKLASGKDGSVGTAANLCSARARRAKAEIDYRGQNGKVLQVAQRLKITGCRHRARHRRRGGRRGRRSRNHRR